MLQEGKRGAPPRCDSNLIGAILSHSGAIALRGGNAGARGQVRGRRPGRRAGGMRSPCAGSAVAQEPVAGRPVGVQGRRSAGRREVSLLADGVTSLRQSYT